MATDTGRAHRSLSFRLLAGQAVVLVAGVLTAGLVAAVVGPPIFHQHLVQAARPADSPQLAHIEQAYRDAGVLSLGMALVISVGCAFAVTWYLTRRLRGPLASLTSAAREIARGHYSARVPATGVGTELDTLAEAFNTMAGRLGQVEDTRRRLLSDLAHELRTPIGTLAAYHDGLSDGVTSWNEEVATVLADQTARLERLARDITDVSAAEEGRIGLDRGRLLVADLLCAAADNARESYAAKGVGLVVVPLVEAGMAVRVDRQRFGQVMGNLLDNALRHTPPGGTVTVDARRIGGEAAVTITDTGDGITPEQLPHVFERFYRGDAARDRDRSGTGIGLTISKAIIDAHGGALTATSAGRGHGATFVLTLPTG